MHLEIFVGGCRDGVRYRNNGINLVNGENSIEIKNNFLK
jgi:hypothetical protein